MHRLNHFLSRPLKHLRLGSLFALVTALSFLFSSCAIDARDSGIGDSDSVDDTEDPVLANDDDVIGDDDDDLPSDDDDDDDDDTPVFFVPKAGDWVITTAEITLDECELEGFMDRGQPGSIFELANTADLSFDLTFGGDEEQTSGGGEVLPCLLDETTLSYECGSSLSERDLNDEFGLDAIIPVEMSAWGSFSSETVGLLTTRVDLTCQGNNCGLVQLLLGTSFPCSMVNETEVEPNE
jgi:hypothetical protein